MSKCLPENLTSYCLSNTDGVYKLEYSSFKTNAWMPSFMVGKMVDSSQGGSTAEDVLTYMSLCDGFVTLLQKPRYAISCPLELGWFPFDTQVNLTKLANAEPLCLIFNFLSFAS